MDAHLLCISEAWACSVTILPSKSRHSNTVLEVAAARNCQKDHVIESYYGTLLYQKLQLRKHTRKVHGDGVLKVNMARISY